MWYNDVIVNGRSFETVKKRKSSRPHQQRVYLRYNLCFIIGRNLRYNFFDFDAIILILENSLPNEHSIIYQSNYCASFNRYYWIQHNMKYYINETVCRWFDKWREIVKHLKEMFVMMKHRISKWGRNPKTLTNKESLLLKG